MYKFLCIVFLLYCGHHSVSQIPGNGGSSESARVKRIYESQLGVRELSGKNDGREVEAYLKTVGLSKGFAWCASFVKYCFLQAGVTTAKSITGAAASCERRTALVYYNRKFSSDIRSADVFCLYYANLGRIGHTGFVDGWANKKAGTVITVEGNTNGGGSRDGDGVYRRIRQIGGIRSISRWTKS